MTKAAWRCPACRTRRASWESLQAHIQASGHAQCGCGGYHYPHRPGSPCCERNLACTLHRAMRADASDEDLWEIQMDVMWGPGKPMKDFP